MAKIDYKKEFKELYLPSPKEAVTVTVPKMNFLMIDGQGDPNTSAEYQQAIEALYNVAYKIKFAVKKALGKDFAVMPLEGLWWTEDMTNFSLNNKSDWKWTMMIMQPEFVTRTIVENTIDEVKGKKKLPALEKLYFQSLDEGQSAQIMHIGPFTEEGPTVEKVHEYIEANAGKRQGKHHEIYLSDIRKADPKKWKTVIRQPYS